jgi:hypothetical protein
MKQNCAVKLMHVHVSSTCSTEQQAGWIPKLVWEGIGENKYLCLVLNWTLVLWELLGFWTLSIVWDSKYKKNTTCWKMDLLPSSGEGGDTLLDPLEIANLNHWTRLFQWLMLACVFVFVCEGGREKNEIWSYMWNSTNALFGNKGLHCSNHCWFPTCFGLMQLSIFVFPSF